MTEQKKPGQESLEDNLQDLSIDSPEGEDSTNPMGQGAKTGQESKAEG